MIEDGVFRTFWWNAESSSELAQNVCQTVTRIKSDDSQRIQRSKENAMLYGEHEAFSYEFEALPGRTRLTMNLIKTVSDLAVSRITKNKPRPKFTASGANFTLRRKAKNLTDHVDWAMEEGNAVGAFQDAFQEATVDGTGFVQCYVEGTKVCYERVPAKDVFVDKLDGRLMAPRSMYRRHFISREVLKKLYPNKDSIIDGAQVALPHEMGMDTSTNRLDLIEVIEAWRKPRKLGDKDGRHVIVTTKGALLDEHFEGPEFPIIPIRFSRRLQGFYGLGVAENLRPIQIEINKTLIKRQRILDQVAVPLIAFEGKMGRPGKLSNAIGVVYNGRPPVILAPRTVPPEIEGYLENLWVKGHVMHGFTPTDATGSLPAGVDSGVAMREYDAIVDGNLSLPHKEYQDAWVAAAKLTVQLSKQIAKKNPKWSPVAANDKYTVRSVQWDDLDMEKDDYVLRCMPASALPTHPAGRLSAVNDMMMLGLLSGPDQAKRLLDFPDLQEFHSLERATADYLDSVMERIIDEGEAIVPEPFQDHQLALKRAMAEYHRCVLPGRDVPPQHLAKLRDFIVACQDHIKEAQLEQQTQQAAVGAPPAVGMEGAPPTAIQPSDNPLPQ